MPDLNCTKFEERLMLAVEEHQTLGDAFDEESEPQSAEWRELRAQAHACPHCRQLWNEFALLERVLPAWKSQIPKVNLADAVLARWREEQSPGSHAAPQDAAAKPKNQRKPNGRFLFSLMLAVAVAVLASVPFWFVPDSNDGIPGTMFPVAITDPPPLPDKLDDPTANAPRPKESEQPPDWQALAQDASSAYRVLASDAADSFASAAVFVPARKPAAEAPKPDTPRPASGWVEGIGTGLKPIGQDVGRAMGFLFEALPSDPPTI
jgi:hypothetical protein